MKIGQGVKLINTGNSVLKYTYRSKIIEEQEHVISQKENEVKLCIEKLQLAIENIDTLNNEIKDLEDQIRTEQKRTTKLMMNCKAYEGKIQKLSEYQSKQRKEDNQNYFDNSIDSDDNAKKDYEYVSNYKHKHLAASKGLNKYKKDNDREDASFY
jgi:chromosome segregation ATPase